VGGTKERKKTTEFEQEAKLVCAREPGGGRGRYIFDIAFAFSSRYRWYSRLVPIIEMPNKDSW
jgi:hypothetical protein